MKERTNLLLNVYPVTRAQLSKEIEKRTCLVGLKLVSQK